MTPARHYRDLLARREQRLRRYYETQQDGHGHELSDTGLRLVERCIVATHADWAESFAAEWAR